MIKLSYNSINDTYLVLINEYEEIAKGCYSIKSQKVKEVSRQFVNSLEHEIKFENKLKQLNI